MGLSSRWSRMGRELPRESELVKSGDAERGLVDAVVGAALPTVLRSHSASSGVFVELEEAGEREAQGAEESAPVGDAGVDQASGGGTGESDDR